MSTKLTMLWDRFMVLERLHLYGWLLDEYTTHAEVDGYYFGDLFADNAYMCGSTHFNVSVPYIGWDEIYPGAPTVNGGVSASDGAGCVANLGTNAQATMTSVANAAHGTGGVYPTNKQQTRHTVNNMLVTEQTTTTMTTQHYQIIERWILVGASERFVAYDGSGYTYQVKWAKVSGIWKITSMKYVIDGHGHLGVPPAQAAHDGFVAGIDALNGRRAEEALAPTGRRLQAPPQYGNLNPLVSRLPAGLTTDKLSAQALCASTSALDAEQSQVQ